MKIRLIVFTSVIVLLAFAVISFIPFFVYCELSNRAKFGDSFGFVNAIFSALAFAFIILNLFLQRKDLNLQKKELKLTRQELSGQKQQMQEQNKTLSIQRIENTFFKMMEFHHSILSGFTLGNTKGGAVLKSIESDLKRSESDTSRYRMKLIEIEHYLRNIVSVFSYLDQNEKIVNVRQYCEIYKQQLSIDDLKILKRFISTDLAKNCNCKVIAKYNVLENLK